MSVIWPSKSLAADVGLQKAEQMSFKKASADQAAQDGTRVSVDLEMSDAKLGATLRGLLGKLEGNTVVAVVPERGRGKGKRKRGVAYKGIKAGHGPVTMAVVEASASDSRNLKLDDLVVSIDTPVKSRSKHQKRFTEAYSVSPSQKGDDLDHAILAAEKRGQVAAASIVDSDDMLSTAEVAERIGISRQAVTKRRNNGQILSLKAGPKALKYPDWQILPTGEVVSGIEDVLARFDGDTWTAFRTLKEIAPDGSGRPLHALLRDGDVAFVLAYIDGILGGAVT